MGISPDPKFCPPHDKTMFNNREVFDAVGGRPVVEKVHKLFYDKLFQHEWLGLFFEGLDQEFIESQQTDFMSSVSGGPKSYVGQAPLQSHMHMYLTEEIFELRASLLDESIREAGVSDAAREAWLRLDSFFRPAVVKKSLQDCKQRYSFEGIVKYQNPNPGVGQMVKPADLDAAIKLLQGRFGMRGNVILLQALEQREKSTAAAGSAQSSTEVRHTLRLLTDGLNAFEKGMLETTLADCAKRGAA
jgi:hemoglobin